MEKYSEILNNIVDLSMKHKDNLQKCGEKEHENFIVSLIHFVDDYENILYSEYNSSSKNQSDDESNNSNQ